MQQMGMATGQQVIPGQVPAVVSIKINNELSQLNNACVCYKRNSYNIISCLCILVGAEAQTIYFTCIQYYSLEGTKEDKRPS